MLFPIVPPNKHPACSSPPQGLFHGETNLWWSSFGFTVSLHTMKSNTGSHQPSVSTEMSELKDRDRDCCWTVGLAPKAFFLSSPFQEALRKSGQARCCQKSWLPTSCWQGCRCVILGRNTFVLCCSTPWMSKENSSGGKVCLFHVGLSQNGLLHVGLGHPWPKCWPSVYPASWGGQVENPILKALEVWLLKDPRSERCFGGRILSFPFCWSQRIKVLQACPMLSPTPSKKEKKKRHDKGPGRNLHSCCLICKIKIRATECLCYFYVTPINHFALPSVTPKLTANRHSSFCTEKQLPGTLFLYYRQKH